MAKVKSVVDTILGEATYGTPQQRYADMVNIASVIANRAAQTRTTPQDVVSVRSEFNAFGKPLPSGAGAYRSLAQKAWDQVQATGPVHGATFYATPKATKNLPKGLQQVTSTSGHVYFSDPQNRAIRTAAGVIKPVANAVRQVANTVGNVADAVTSPVRQVAAGVGNMASALRTAAFPSMSPAPRPSVDVPGLLSYDLAGAKRSQIPTSGIAEKVAAVANSVIPGTTTTLYSGMEPRGLAAVGAPDRHPRGFAGDFYFTAPNGQTITDPVAMQDIAMSMAAKHNANIGYGRTGYMGPARMHIDTMPLGQFPGGAQWGNTAKSWANNLDFARATGIGPTPYTNAPTPTARPTAPDSLMAAPLGKVERAPLQAAAPRAPDAARFGYDTMPNPERFGPRAPTATAKVDRLPASAIPEPDPARFAYDVNPTQAKPAGLGLVTPAAASVPASPNAGMSLAQQYASYGAGRVQNPTPALNAVMSPNVGPLPQSFNPVAGSLMAPVSLPSLQPPAPVPVTTPKAPRLMTPNQRIDQAFKTAAVPAAPQFTASDVYAGRANSGLASDGSTVSRDQYGNTSVTNKYGVTTTTNANGQQMASGGPGIGGPIGGQGIQAPPSPPSNLGSKVRGGLGTVVGGGLGGFLGGPIGAALGAVVAGDLAKGRNPLDRLGLGTFSMPVTDQFGFTQQMRFANPKAGGPFPNAPMGARGALGGSESNLSDRQMRDISPRAADAISKGQGGLY